MLVLVFLIYNIRSRAPVTIAVNSTGVKVHKAGCWVERKHDKKSRYVKLHFAVNTETHEAVAMDVSTDDVHDVKALPGLVEESKRRVRVARIIGDGAYDSSTVYDLLEGRGIEVTVKPKRNSRPGLGSPERRRAIKLYRCLGHGGWAGLAPSLHQSGSVEYSGRITKQGSKMLRWAMVESARTAVRHDERMRGFYERVKRRRGDGKAVVAVACKMLKIIWFMLTRREAYQSRNEGRYGVKLKSLRT